MKTDFLEEIVQLDYDSTHIINVSTNPNASMKSVREVLYNIPMDEYDSITRKLYANPATTVYALEELAYFACNHMEDIAHPVNIELVNHQNITVKIFGDIFDKFVEKIVETSFSSTKRNNDFSDKNLYTAKFGRNILKHPLITADQLGLISNVTDGFTTELLLNKKTPSTVVDKMLLGKNLKHTERYTVLFHENLSSKAAVSYFVKNYTNSVHSRLKERHNWKEILFLTLQKTYPEITEDMPLMWLEEMLEFNPPTRNGRL